MEKYKLRISDMMPNAWFFKLKKPSPPLLERETAPPFQPRRSSNYIPSHQETPENSSASSDLSHLRLPPILTKLPNQEEEDDISSPSLRRYSKKIQSLSDFKYLSKGSPVVKFSSNPQRDFRESMEEMMRENSISSYKDLEELLACFLSLNSGEYHGDIFRAFEEIRSDLADRRRRQSCRPRHCR